MNKKKIVLLWSSPNEDGLTASAAKAAMQGVLSQDAELVSVHVMHCKA